MDFARSGSISLPTRFCAGLSRWTGFYKDSLSYWIQKSAMQSTHFRNKFALLGYQITVLLLLVSGLSYGQHFAWAKRNNPEYDKRKISYGFMIGIHTSAYQLKYSDKFVTQNFDTVHSVQGSFTAGFSLGFLVNLRLNEVLDLRIMPKAGFYNHKLNYYYTDNTSEQIVVETTMYELPILLKYKSMRRGNVRMYMVGGFTPCIEASGKNDVEIQHARSRYPQREPKLSMPG